MSLLLTLWGLLFRLFPAPTRLGLRAIGAPDNDSPILVTCNFDLTVRRLTRVLRRAGIDAWLLVAESRGINVWCAAGGDEFNTLTVAAAIKMSGLKERGVRPQVILPPLAGPAVDAVELRRLTGYKLRWGPVRMLDLPAYLAAGRKRSPAMKRATYDLRERLDTALGSLFPFWLLGALGFGWLAPDLLGAYLLTVALSFLAFLGLCPWLPGSRGLTKVLSLELPLAVLLVANHLYWREPWVFVVALMAMVLLLVNASELGGLASIWKSDLDPFMAKLGLGGVGNVAWAGALRTDLLLGRRELTYDPAQCNGCRRCFEICPIGCWAMGEDKRARLARPDACTACRACLTQCPTEAITAAQRRG